MKLLRKTRPNLESNQPYLPTPVRPPFFVSSVRMSKVSFLGLLPLLKKRIKEEESVLVATLGIVEFELGFG